MSAEPTAVCRGCNRPLRGRPYHLGGAAYHPETGERCPSNFYGGFVCSETCDRRASLELDQTMPGHQGQTKISSYAEERVRRSWARPG